MKLKDRITINRAGLVKIDATVEDHLLDFAYSCSVDMQKEWDERKEYSFDLINAATVALGTLNSGNDIEEMVWDAMLDLMDDREWVVIEEADEE